MALTVTEKEHWKNRISRRIEQAIEATYASSDAGFLERVNEEARKRAIESLGLTDLKAQLAKLEDESKANELAKKATHKKMMAVVRGCSLEELDYVHYCGGGEVNGAINVRRDIHRKEVLAESVIGRQILELEKEKEELLDTVWLATSGKQIKELWEGTLKLLGQQSTSLQSEALRIEPQEGE